MNLYVWNAPYRVEWGSCVLYAVAKNLTQAKKIANKAQIAKYGMYLSSPARGDDWLNLGEPDRILPVPCAEIYHWEE